MPDPGKKYPFDSLMKTTMPEFDNSSDIIESKQSFLFLCFQQVSYDVGLSELILAHLLL